jgi:hypothetical protein
MDQYHCGGAAILISLARSLLRSLQTQVQTMPISAGEKRVPTYLQSEMSGRR